MDSGQECTLEVFEQISEDMGQKKTPETLSQTGGDRLKSHTFLSENQEFVFGLVEEFGIFQRELSTMRSVNSVIFLSTISARTSTSFRADLTWRALLSSFR